LSGLRIKRICAQLGWGRNSPGHTGSTGPVRTDLRNLDHTPRCMVASLSKDQAIWARPWNHGTIL